MKVITSQNHKPIKAWIDHVPVEQSAMQQLRNIASMPFIHSHVAAMPDVHWGMGATVGSVIATHKAVIPAAVGVDIGCGMMACRTTIRADQLPDSLSALRSTIEMAVPHGRTDNGGANDRGAHQEYRFGVAYADAWKRLEPTYLRIIEKYPRVAHLWLTKQLGTLGGGNHFIEICTDEDDYVWAMLHSGSRGVGNKIGSHFISLAKEEMKRWHVRLPDADLAYLPEGSEYFRDYITAVEWAQAYALENRKLMMNEVLNALRTAVPTYTEVTETAVNCHHNYVSRENHFGENVIVTRKGAVSAKEDQLGIIPGSMGQKSYIVRGKGNADSFHSCSHGAGRAMSRGEAKRTFTVEDHIRDTEGVECRKDAGVIDETPKAYKDLDAVMESQKDLVDIVHTLKAVLCVKG